MTRVSHGIDRIDATFDDPNLVANAGLLLVATLSQRLGLEALIDATVRLAGRVGGARPGRKVLTLVHAMIAGASHIDHADMLRAGSTAAVLGHRVMAPSTLGTFLRAFTFGHVRQLEAVVGRVLERAWAAGAGPGDGAVGDRHRLDDLRRRRQTETGCRVRLHPRPRLPPDPRHPRRQRRGAARPDAQRIKPTPSAAPAGSSMSSSPASAAPAPPARSRCRMDSGFWSNDTIATLNRLDVRYTMAVRTSTTGIADAIARDPRRRLGRHRLHLPTAKPKSPSAPTPPAAADGA